MSPIVQPTPALSYAPLIVFSLVPLVFWMVIAWRAMRAHEQIAEALAELAKKSK